MKEVTPNLFRCQFFEILQFSETRQLGERVFYWAVFFFTHVFKYVRNLKEVEVKEKVFKVTLS